MGSMVLPYSLTSLTITPSSRSLKPGLNVSHSLSTLSLSSSRISISRVSSCRFEPTLASPVVPRRRRSTALSASSSLGEEETAGDVEAVQALENESEEENPVAPDSEAEAKPPRKPIIKLGDIMGILNKRAVEASEKERPVPDIRTGDIVMIKMEVQQNRRRAAIYKGIVMSRQNAGIHTTIRIRRIIAGVGVEIVFPLYSPNIKEIKVVSHRKVRRARLYFLRDKLPRLSTFK